MMLLGKDYKFVTQTKSLKARLPKQAGTYSTFPLSEAVQVNIGSKNQATTRHHI